MLTSYLQYSIIGEAVLAAASQSTPAASASSASGDPTENTAAAEASSSSVVPQDTGKAAADTTVHKTQKGIRASVSHMVSTVWSLRPGIAAVWKRALVVDILVTLQVRLLVLSDCKYGCVQDQIATPPSAQIQWCPCQAS